MGYILTFLNIPSDPTNIDASSDKMSPNMLPHTIVSNCLGLINNYVHKFVIKIYKISPSDQLHSTVINIHVRQLDLWIVFFASLDDYFSPQLGHI